MADDLYGGKWGGVVAVVAVIAFLGAFYFESLVVRNSIWIAFFFGFAIFNFINYKVTEKSKYLVSGVVFFIACAAGAFNAFARNFISWRAIWLISITLFVLAGPIASLLRSLGVIKKGKTNEKP